MSSRHFLASVLFLVGLILPAQAVEIESLAKYRGRLELARAIDALCDIIEPAQNRGAFVATLKLVSGEGLPANLVGATAEVSYLPPDRLRIVASVGGSEYSVGRDGDQIWVHESPKKFAVLGKPGVLRFSGDPQSVDQSHVPPMGLPMSRTKMMLASVMLDPELLDSEKVGDQDCRMLRLRAGKIAASFLKNDSAQADVWIRESDHLPVRVDYSDSKRHVRVEVTGTRYVVADEDRWALHTASQDHVETVAVSHLLSFLQIAPRMLVEKCPALPAATGERQVIATEGRGRLEMIDGARLLFLKGSPKEMGHQHGVLLKNEIHAVANRILYGFGVGSSFARGAWFFGEIERAEGRLRPFMDARYLEEEDAIAEAAGMNPQEARLANFFPELFHCSGFAITGKASGDGHIYHGRVLDYLRGVGLEQNAVTIVHQPDYGHAWINFSYAGFVGTVTAMNDQGISIGEMGGGAYGNWDGKPMAHLLREVMEKASTLDEAVKIMRDSPRTCQYYYVIADGKTRDAVGIAASPTEFTTLKPGEFHPLLPKPQSDAVLLSAGDRYNTLVDRVKENYGHFDLESARKLMEPPVCMSSNIQSVLFAPDTMDVWVANADSQNVASLTRYTHYNLRELLKQPGN